MRVYLSDVQKIKDLKIEHKYWTESLDQSQAILSSIDPGEVLFIIGPSRAGKTKLKDTVIGLLSPNNDYSSTGYMTVVSTEAANCSKNGSFSTKSFTKRLLNAVEHPIYGMSTLEGLSKQDRISEDTYRQALEYALKARKVKYIFIDEAHHVSYATKDALGAYAVMDSWKCLAQVCGVILVIVGAYPILDIVRNSPHMLGRRYQVDLARYKLNYEDLMEFRGIVKQYGDLINSTSFLMSNLDFIYHGSLGCIGLVRRWLIDAGSRAGVRKCALTLEILRETMPDQCDLDVISGEITNREPLLEGKDLPFESHNQYENRPKKSSGKPFQRKAERINPDRRNGGGI